MSPLIKGAAGFGKLIAPFSFEPARMAGARSTVSRGQARDRGPAAESRAGSWKAVGRRQK
jgi:hypothetical protein